MRARKSACGWCPSFLRRLVWDVKLQRGVVRDCSFVGHAFAEHLEVVAEPM